MPKYNWKKYRKTKVTMSMSHWEKYLKRMGVDQECVANPGLPEGWTLADSRPVSGLTAQMVVIDEMPNDQLFLANYDTGQTVALNNIGTPVSDEDTVSRDTVDALRYTMERLRAQDLQPRQMLVSPTQWSNLIEGEWNG
jgi:hypothetical protein